MVFTAAAIARICDKEYHLQSLYSFSPAGIIILTFVIYYVVGYITFLISLSRMYSMNKNLLFPENRKEMMGVLVMTHLRCSFLFQFLFYAVASMTFFFLGSMDHMLSRPNICSATNKDSINISRCEAFWEAAKFNSGSWPIAIYIAVLAYCTVIQDEDWDVTKFQRKDIVGNVLFEGPPLFLAFMTFVVPIILNPYVLGRPFISKAKPAPKTAPLRRKENNKIGNGGAETLDIKTFMKAADLLECKIERKDGKPDIEIGSLYTDRFANRG